MLTTLKYRRIPVLLWLLVVLLPACTVSEHALEPSPVLTFTPNMQATNIIDGDSLIDPESPTSTPILPMPPTETIVIATPQATTTPFQSTSVPIPEIWIVYKTDIDQDDVFNGSQVWVYSALSSKKELAFSTEPGSAIDRDVKWDPINSKAFYYIQVEESNHTWALWKYDLSTQERKQITDKFPSGFGIILDFSTDGQWVRLYSEDHSLEEIQITTVLVDTLTGKHQNLDIKNGAWLSSEPHHFAYYDPQSDPKNIVVNNVDSMDIVKKIDISPILGNLIPNLVITWRPQSEELFVASNESPQGSGQTIISYEIYRYELSRGEWSEFTELGGSVEPKLIWSPNGRWLAIDRSDAISVIDQEFPDERKLIISGNFTYSLDWLRGVDQLVVFSDGYLYIADPTATQVLQELSNLTEIEAGLADGTIPFDIAN